MSLSKTVALVTGGSSGLGAAAVRRLRSLGAKVMIADLREPWEDASILDEQDKNNVLWSKVDVTNPDDVTAALDSMELAFGRPLNACIQCAGIATARKMISSKGHLHSVEEFTKTLHVNTVGTFTVARAAVERMQHNTLDSDKSSDNLRGCLIHTASIAAYEGQIGQVAYAASKAAIVGMTLPLARDLAPLGIRVMTIVRLLRWRFWFYKNKFHDTTGALFCFSLSFIHFFFFFIFSP